MKNLLFVILFIQSFTLLGQDTLTLSFSDKFDQYKSAYIADRSNEDGPISPEEAKNINFFDADSTFVVMAKVEMLDQKDTLTMPTVNGKLKKYIKYAYLHFEFNGQKSKLLVFRSVRLMKNPLYKNALFLPFYDYSNGRTTYGGGRYMDLSTLNIVDGQIELAFNRCYNPYCAYTT